MDKHLNLDPETSFLCGLLQLQYSQDVSKQLKTVAAQVPWARGWPDNPISFWNAEAFMWKRKINEGKKKVIAEELYPLSKGRNLDVGCGAYSYIPSTGIDFSEKMLSFNDNCREKVNCSLENKLPFLDNCFDSATAIFLFNYIKNYHLLLLEIKRVLNEKGVFMMVQYSGKVNDWQRQKEVNMFNSDKWKNILERAGFLVDFYEKDKLWFFRCSKDKTAFRKRHKF